MERRKSVDYILEISLIHRQRPLARCESTAEVVFEAANGPD